MRLTHHLAVLLLLGVMTLSGVGARWTTGESSVVLAAPALTPTPARPPAASQGSSSGTATSSSIVSSLAAGGSGTVLPVLVAPSPSPVASVAAPITTLPVPPPTPAVARQWVQNFKATELFDGPDTQAASLGTLPQFTTLEIVEQVEGGRSRLFDPGRGEGRLPGAVWANLGDFGPAGPPKYTYELAKGGDIVPVSGRPAPERTVDAWPILPSAEAAVILDGETGALLYGKSAHARLPQASTTKIMTAIVAIEAGRLQDRVTVDVDSEKLYLATESTVMGLMPGQTVSVETLLYGLMLSSGNDAAIALAKHIAGSEARFVQLMNEKARDLGLHDTQYKNPHGLDADGHYSSAYDLVILSRYAMQNPRFYSLSNTRHWNADGFDLWNLNKLLNAYPGADGVKPGFTDNAGRCLVGSAVRDNRRMFVAVLHSLDTTADSRALLDFAFDSYRWPT